MTKEVSFLPDERALLDWLQAHAKSDGVVTVTDTRLISQLKLTEEPQRFFQAKMRLVTAGAIALYIDGQGHQIVQLIMPERANPKSARYVFTVVPLELAIEIRKLVHRHRTRKVEEKAREAAIPPSNVMPPVTLQIAMPAGAAVPPPSPKPKPRPSFAHMQKNGMARLGVRPAPSVHPPGPIKPPLAKPKEASG